MIPLLLALGLAHAEAPIQASLGGDVKTFMVAVFPYDLAVRWDAVPGKAPAGEVPIMSADSTGQGIADFRLKLDVRAGDVLRLQVHHALTVSAPGTALTLGTSSAGVGLAAPEAVDLSWQESDLREAATGEGLRLGGRVDRAVLKATLPHVDLALGRQPVTFGRAMMFTPLDLVSPFSPAVIDQEYKPGVDAARVDAYAGTSSQLTLVAAYAGDWAADGMVYAAYAQAPVGVWDVGLFGASVQRDLVGGLSLSGSVGPVGLHVEGTWTAPDQGDPFARAVLGGEWMPGAGKTTLAGELYYQSWGDGDYLALSSDPRVARGELWTLGHTYGGLSLSQELTPLVHASLFSIVNLADPSAMVGPGLSWSIADNAELAAGGYIGLGERPKDADITPLVEQSGVLGLDEQAVLGALSAPSEFGLVPTVAYLQVKAYF